MRAPATPRSKSLSHAVLLGLGIIVLALVAIPLNDTSLLRPDSHSLLLDVGINIILAVSLNLILGITGQFSLGHAGFLAAGAYTAGMVAGSNIRPQLHFWREQLGFSMGSSLHAMMLCGVLEGIIVAGILGLLVGLPTLRLRGDYLAIATLGFGEIMAVIIQNSTALGGSTGFAVASQRQEWITSAMTPEGDPTPLAQALADFLDVNRYSVGFFWVFLGVLVAVMVVRNIKYSTSGRALLAIREDLIASESVGIATTRYKVSAFVIGAALAGLGGGLLSHHKSLNPDSFRFTRSIEIVAMVILGGQGSITGSILAATVLTVLPEELRSSTMLRELAGRVGVKGSQWDDVVLKWRMVIYSLAIVLSMLTRPQGIFGRYEINDLWRWVWRHFSRGKQREPTFAASEESAAFYPETLAGIVGQRPHDSASPLLENVPLLQTSALGMSFGGLRALDDLNLQVAQGELVGLIGPNGAGKTTVFNLLTGVYQPTDGNIMLGARRVIGDKPHTISAAGVARTFQNIRLFANLTVLDNVLIAQHAHHRQGFPAAILRTPAFFREEEASRLTALGLLKLFKLDHLSREQANSLAYGDQRRLEIARALATRPKLLLLDEPAAGMNPSEKRDLMETIQRIRQQFGLAILIIEHDMKVVMGICERITVLDYGKTIACGSPEAIRKDPAVIQAYLGNSKTA